MKCIFRCAFTAWVILFSRQALAQPSARELLDKARDAVASAPALRRVDTTEQSVVLIHGQSRKEQKPQTNVVTIEIEMPKHLARQTATIQNQQLVMLKQGEGAAMKLGSGPWETPSGPYENLAKDMGNLFVCEMETPETSENAPVWKLTGTELLDSQEALVIETEGNTAVALAQARMAEGMAKVFSGDPARRPTVKVLEYSSKHWISKSDYRRLQAVQVSKTLVTLSLPDGKEQQVEQSMRATSRYSYEKVAIEIPEEARKVLSLGNLPSPMPLLKIDLPQERAKP
jgi:hypothetical protein